MSVDETFQKPMTLTGSNVGQLGSERSSTRGVSELDLGNLGVLVEFGQLGSDTCHVELPLALYHDSGAGSPSPLGSSSWRVAAERRPLVDVSRARGTPHAEQAEEVGAVG